MKNYRSFAIFLIFISCKSPDRQPVGDKIFASVAEKFATQPGLMDEASGMAASRTIADHLWIEQDGGNPDEINLVSNDGQLVCRISLPFPNRDWEDLGIGPGPQNDVSYLYMADIGDNDAQFSECYIYRFAEPRSVNQTVTQFDKITFQYPDGPRDAETILIDPLTKDIFIVSKRESKARLYKLPYPQSIKETIQATYLGELPVFAPTGGSVSLDGSEVLIRTYLDAKYWRRFANQSLDDLLLRKEPVTLSVEMEPQGEAIAFNKAGSGYYTISERASAESVTLNFYKRL